MARRAAAGRDAGDVSVGEGGRGRVTKRRRTKARRTRARAALERVVVLAPNWLGDVVMALPAIAAVRRWFADAHLAVAARAPVAPLLSMADGIDEVITLAGRGDWRDGDGPACRRAPAGVGPLRCRAAAAQLVSCRLARAPGRRARALGVSRRSCAAMLLTRGVARPRGPVTQAAYYLALVRALGGTRRAADRGAPGGRRPARGRLGAAAGQRLDRRPVGGLRARRRVRAGQAVAAGARRPGRARACRRPGRDARVCRRPRRSRHHRRGAQRAIARLAGARRPRRSTSAAARIC